MSATIVLIVQPHGKHLVEQESQRLKFSPKPKQSMSLILRNSIVDWSSAMIIWDD